MKTIDKTIHALAKALYETRPSPAAAFDPDYVLGELAHAGAQGAMALLAARCQLGGFALSYDKERMTKVMGGSASAQAEDLYLKYWDAILQHPPFTDVLGLANELMVKKYGVCLPDYFLSREGRAYCRDFARFHLAHGLPFLKDENNRSSSGVLASLAGLLSQPDLLRKRKVRILMFCQSDLATRMMLMQLFSPLTNFMQFVEWVKIAEGSETNARHLISVQRQNHLPAVAQCAV